MKCITAITMFLLHQNVGASSPSVLEGVKQLRTVRRPMSTPSVYTTEDFLKLFAPIPSMEVTPTDGGSCGRPSDYHPNNNRANSRAIYGVDSRYDEADVSSCWQEVGRSTAMLVKPEVIEGNVWSDCGTLESRHQCPTGLRFGDQQTCGSCSGTLIAPNKIATAGHCVSDWDNVLTDEEYCTANIAVIFGATSETVLAGNEIPPEHVYACSSVDKSVWVEDKDKDWAVFTLDRDVPASVATPVAVGSQQMPMGAGLMMIGHPTGLPTKYADDATIQSVANSGTDRLYYTTNLDAFGGNSGSGVFTTGFAENEAGDGCYTAAVMVGILVSGQTDYDQMGCPVTYPQREDGFPVGETVTGALVLLPYAQTQQDSSTLVDCGGSSSQPPASPTRPSVVFEKVGTLMLTSAEVPETSDFGAQCKSEYGSTAQVADWSYDLLSLTTDQVDEMTAVLGIPETFNEKNYYVSNGGDKFARGTSRAYFFEDHGGNPPSNWLVHDQLGDITLGSWYDISGQVLCIEPTGTKSDHRSLLV